MPAIEAFDQSVWNGLQSARLKTPSLLPVIEAMSWLGHPLILALVAAGLALCLWRRGRGRAAVAALLAVAGALVLAYGAKALVGRVRPDPFGPTIARPTTSSFPSAHALAAAAVYFFLGLVLGQSVRGRLAGWGLMLGLGMLVIAVGFSRMYLSVNFLSDVAAGWVAGLLWALACLWWCQVESNPIHSPV